MRCFHAAVLTATLICTSAQASPHEAGQDAAPPGQGRIILTTEASLEARAVRMTQVVRTPEGYARGVSERAGGLANVPVDPADFNARSGQDVQRIGSFVLQGTMGAEPAGAIVLYADAAGQRMTVTLRHYRRDGEVHNLDADAINARIGGRPAGVSLATAPGKTDALWSIVTWDDERLFIIEIADVLGANGAPARSYASVKALAADIVTASGQ